MPSPIAPPQRPSPGVAAQRRRRVGPCGRQADTTVHYGNVRRQGNLYAVDVASFRRSIASAHPHANASAEAVADGIARFAHRAQAVPIQPVAVSQRRSALKANASARAARAGRATRCPPQALDQAETGPPRRPRRAMTHSPRPRRSVTAVSAFRAHGAPLSHRANCERIRRRLADDPNRTTSDGAGGLSGARGEGGARGRCRPVAARARVFDA
jgi:hypothetical protein